MTNPSRPPQPPERTPQPPAVVTRLRALDPLWVATAETCGFRIVRSLDAWVAYDGDEGIHIAAPEELDDDDCLAQILLHELCHWLIEGPDARTKPDWGLCNQDARHLEREYAALALQRVCAGAHDLLDAMAPTTEHWRVWANLPGWCPTCEDTLRSMWTRPQPSADVPECAQRTATLHAAMASVPESFADVPGPAPAAGRGGMWTPDATAAPAPLDSCTPDASPGRCTLHVLVSAAIRRASLLGTHALIDDALRETARRLRS